MEQCLFCNIVAGKIPSYKVYEDESFVSILDINPANPGHLVLIPKAHHGSIMEMQDQEYFKFFVLSRSLSLALLEFGAQGVNFYYSMGAAAGQRVPHMLLHVIPRYAEDKVRFGWEPQQITEEQFKTQQQNLSELIGKSKQFAQQPQQQIQPPPQQIPMQQPQQPVQPPPEEKKKIYQIEPRRGGYWG